MIELAIALRSNKSLRSVDISRPLLFSLQVRTLRASRRRVVPTHWIQSGLSQEEWAGHFAAMLAVNGGLLELHLAKMGMTDTGMERLAEGLQLNRSLRYLDLRW